MALAATAAFVLSAWAAGAYQLRSDRGRAGCEGDGSACHVYCDNGDRAGTMYFNGSVWADGVRRHENRDVLAQMIVDANGSACK